MLRWMEANVVAVSNVSDPVMRGSGGAMFRDLVNVEEQLSDGCQHISSRIMADTRAGVRPGRTAKLWVDAVNSTLNTKSRVRL